MKRFSFDLEKLLELRSYHEQEAEIVLGRAMGEAASIQQRIMQIAQERSLAAAERFMAGRSIHEIRSTELYIRRLDNTKDALLEAAAKAELKVAQAREAFIEASREKKVLDKLREKRLKEYKKQAALEETKAMDDIYSSTRIRRAIQDGSVTTNT